MTSRMEIIVPAGDAPRLDRSRGLGPRRILVAEDDEAMRLLLVETFRRDGYAVEEAVDGLDLFRRIEEHVALGGRRGHAISAIVSDVRMPGLSGLDILAILRCGTWRTPVVLMTAFADDDVRREAEDGGAVLIDKPFSLDDLRRTVRMLIAAG